MASEAVNKYIEKRYARWLDYAKYLCSLSGMAGEEIDVLNEVLITILEKTDEETDRMLETKKGKYTDLDCYILKTIRLNVTSDTAPYRHKYKTIPIDKNVDWRRLNVVDDPEPTFDNAAYIQEKTEIIRELLVDLHLSAKANRIFKWKFFAGESFADWPGPESRKELYTTYKRVFKAIMDKKNGELFF